SFNAAATGLFGISWMQNDAWTEGRGNPGAPGITGITFNILQGLISGGDENLGAFAFNGATNGTAIYSLGLSSGLVADAQADSNVSELFNSKNFATAANRPLLTIAAVPEPSVAALGVATIGLRVARKKLASKSLNRSARRAASCLDLIV